MNRMCRLKGEAGMPSAYMPHIDGIRALAVIPVVLYHLWAPLCPGGFAGVDVFFVISGFLITGGILRQLDDGCFTFREFYHRRIKRILPAYFAMIVAVFIAGCVLYYSIPLRELGDTMVMGTLFSANLHFYGLAGDYFAESIHANPLLHLWSLGVEEQFYIFMPLICLALWKWARRGLFVVLACLAGISLMMACALVFNGNVKAAFYLLPFRAWEILAGSLVAIMVRRGFNARRLLEEGSGGRIWFSWLGLFCVLVPYVVLTSSSPFPGIAAVLSVLGASCLIVFGADGKLGRLLGSAPFVFVGKISYSLYLWHWPVMVYWNYVREGQLGGFDYVGMLILSSLLGYASWRLIEVPTRLSVAWGWKRSYRFAASGIVGLTVVGLACAFGRGWPGFLHAEANCLVPTVNDRPGFFERKALLVAKQLGVHPWFNNEAWLFAYGGDGAYRVGRPGRTDVLLVGDSRAGSLRFGMDCLLRDQGLGGIGLSASATYVFVPGSEAYQEVRYMLDTYPEISCVVLAHLWATPSHRKTRRIHSFGDVAPSLEIFLEELASRGKKVFLLGDYPVFKESIGESLAKQVVLGNRSAPGDANASFGVPLTALDCVQDAVDSQLMEIALRKGATFIPLRESFLNGSMVEPFCRLGSSVTPRYRDWGHLTPEGSIEIACQWVPQVLPNVPRVSRPEDLVPMNPWFWRQHGPVLKLHRRL